jgi:hypothetical protein
VNNGPTERRSGLRNPNAAVRGLGVATLLLEALALLMAVQPLRVVGVATLGIAAVLVLAGAAAGLAALLRFPVTWHLVWLLNAAVVLTGWFQWALAALGVAFSLVWWYVLHVRRTILGPGDGPDPVPTAESDH